MQQARLRVIPGGQTVRREKRQPMGQEEYEVKVNRLALLAFGVMLGSLLTAWWEVG